MRIVVDLDGTLCRGNTFRMWTIAAFLKRNRVNRRRYVGSVAIFFVLYALRLMRAIDHWQLKRLFVIFWGIYQQRGGTSREAHEFNQQFAESICKCKLNSRVIAKVRELESEHGSKIALATAAPALYARYIAEWLGADCLASMIEDEQLAASPFRSWSENVREAKRDRVAEWLNGEQFILFTDHEDDWPLIVDTKKAFLVAPSRRLVSRVADAGSAWETID